MPACLHAKHFLENSFSVDMFCDRIQDTGYMKVLGLSASVLAGGYRYNLITLVRGSHNFTSMDGKSKSA